MFLYDTGLVKTDEGSIYLDKENITEQPIHKSAHGQVIYPKRLRALRSQYLFCFELLNLRSKKKLFMDDLIQEFSLDHVKGKRRTLSGGRGIAEIVRVLALRPKFLLDEPFVGVDL